jgi:hypothetical protein
MSSGALHMQTHSLFQRPVAVAATGLALLVVMSSCATIRAKKDGQEIRLQVIDVASDPAGADVFVNGARTGVTPLKVTLDRRTRQVTFHVEKTGYESTELVVHRSGNPWLVGDAALMLLAATPNGLGDPTPRSDAVAVGLTFTLMAFIDDFATKAAFAFPRHVAIVLKPIVPRP